MTTVCTGVHAEGPMDTVAVEVDPVDEATGGFMRTMHGVPGCSLDYATLQQPFNA